MINKKWMIYGANGYTGRLVVDEAVKRGLKPILAGRSESVREFADENGLDARVFDLSSVEMIAEKLSDVNVLANCAGPFSRTAEPMMHACIKSQSHYIDITGEISVYQFGHGLDSEAKSAGVVICPGVGFDVIPTDCLAAHLKEKMPDATHLTLGFAMQGSKLSKGTAKTSVEGMAHGGKIRENGELKQVPLAYKEREIDFGFGSRNAITIPWGDVYTAYHSTGIPNIEVFFPQSPKGAAQLRKRQKLLKLMKINWVRKFVQNRIDKIWKPNTPEQRAEAKSYLWGEVKNASGDTIEGRFTTVDGYDLTACGTVEVAEYLMGEHGQTGYFTPSLLMGKNLIEKMPGYSGIEYK
ncbi:MAG: saccharopine dehydrogenase NADP-binding domain-containing protein [Candidatus Marinimicrobia bacterium]|nr:saccharopine dehydrogenase NADP-binding domain-containing protein [Candidatus Neomarinimicrobiota bacterium]MBL7010483.1 saccharopine dehydrogenase NADP-binding domain-containing protein [Candidatus Neomarinimicrobiota bacterium]MBL7030922.1 saccharopine dehydrogenase NADP-binding domain-containing protein [Candidatus Neomarinimicrobiota bacterium]